jgi:hypothetical protein
MLSADDSRYERVQALARAYVGAVRKRFPPELTKFLPLARGNVTKSKHYKLMLAAAEALIELEVPPAAWCLWCCDVWRERGNAGYPPVGYVFSVKFIRERHGWFASEENDYAGGRLLLTDEVRELYRLWQRAATAADGARGGGEAAVAAAVARVMPAGAWERAVRRAKESLAAARRNIREHAEAGECLW